MQTAAFLKHVPLFEGLSDKDLQLLSRITHERACDKGQTIFSQADAGDTLFVVAKGLVKIFSLSRTGKMKTFAYLESRDFFGEMALLEKGGRSAAAMAVRPAVLLTIRRQEFEKLLKEKPQLSLSLLRVLTHRLRRADKEIEALSFNSVVGRLAGILLDLAKRHGKKTDGGTLIDMELSHQEVADMAGTAREMVTRVLNRFIRTGCLKLDGKSFILTDAEKLQEWVY
jgi:CRP/FNR family cyclic AMP-dependent transcriptional regulator